MTKELDRKSSRGMIYENEELRLKTININAEIERGQSDIKKLRRENEMLKKEIWCLRDEYEKLDKLLKDKDVDFSSSSTTYSSDSESCSSCTEELEEVETSQNIENVQKTNLKNLHVEFDHLSVVPEENSTPENSDKNSASLPVEEKDIIQPDQSYPDFPMKKHFFSPLPNHTYEQYEHYGASTSFINNTFQPEYHEEVAVPLTKSSSDVIVKMDNRHFSGSTFSNGGNLEELLNDIHSISEDILKISNGNLADEAHAPYKSELNVVLMPTPMPLIGFEKYENLKTSNENLEAQEFLPPPQQIPFLTLTPTPQEVQIVEPDYFFPTMEAENFFERYNPETARVPTPTPIELAPPPKAETEISTSRSNLLDVTSSDHISSENEENLKFTTKNEVPEKKKSKMSIRRKVSIHFKGKKDKKKNEQAKKQELEKPRTPIGERKLEAKHQKTPSMESHKSDDKKHNSLEEKKLSSAEPKSSGSERNSQKQRKSTSVSPDRKHVQLKDDKKHKKHKKAEKLRQRRSTISTDRVHRERSFSVCTDRSNILDNRLGFSSNFSVDELNSDRERTNSASSCGTVRMRKMSNMSNFPVSGKIPWCGCWGNGCI